MPNKSYIPLLMLKGLNIVIDQKLDHETTPEMRAALEREKKINKAFLQEALKHPFGPMKYLINYLPSAWADKIAQTIDPLMPEQYFYRNKMMYTLLAASVSGIQQENSEARINVVNLGGGFDWRIDDMVTNYQQKGANIHYTIVDKPEILEIRHDIMSSDTVKSHMATTLPIYHPADLNNPQSIHDLAVSLPASDATIVWAKGLQMYLQPQAANAIYTAFGPMPDSHFLSTTFNSFDTVKDDKGKRQGKFVEYQSCIKDDDIEQWAKDNGIEIGGYLLPDQWLTKQGLNEDDKKALNQRPNVERIIYAQGLTL